MSDWSRVPRTAWMLALFLVSVLMGAAADAQHDGPSCRKVPDLGIGLKKVQDVRSTLDDPAIWGAGKWVVVVAQDYDDVKNMVVKSQHPSANSGLTTGEFMHLYVAGSEGFVDTLPEKAFVCILILIIIVLAWRCWKK